MTILQDAITIAWFSSSLWLTMMILGFLIHLARHHRRSNTTGRHRRSNTTGSS